MQLNVKDADYKFVVVSMGIQMMYDGKNRYFTFRFPNYCSTDLTFRLNVSMMLEITNVYI